MLGELAEVNKVFSVGDTYNFDIEQFRGTLDTNLNMLFDFFYKLEDIMNSLANINAITEKELDEFEGEDDEEEGLGTFNLEFYILNYLLFTF